MGEYKRYDPDSMTVGEVARLFKVSQRTVQRWTDKGWVQYRTIPNSKNRRFRYKDRRDMRAKRGLDTPTRTVIAVGIKVSKDDIPTGLHVLHVANWFEAGRTYEENKHNPITLICQSTELLLEDVNTYTVTSDPESVRMVLLDILQGRK